MFNSKNVSLEFGGVKPVISPGNHVVKINDVVAMPAPYDAQALNVFFYLETEPIQGDFNGFLIDRNNENGPRYKGQIGRVTLNRYAYKDTVLPNGARISAAEELTKGLTMVAEAIGKRSEFDEIFAETAEEYVSKAKEIFVSDTYYNVCVGGKEYEKDGYTNYYLFFPKPEGNMRFPISELTDNSRVIPFDPSTHIIQQKQPQATTSNISDGFDL